MISSSGFGISLMLASQNEFRSVPSSTILWDILRKIGVNSHDVWWNYSVKARWGFFIIWFVGLLLSLLLLLIQFWLVPEEGLRTVWGHSLQDCEVFALSVCPLPSGGCPEAGVGFLEGRACACPLGSRAGSWPAGGQCQGLGGSAKSLGSLSADGWGCVPVQLVVWLEASQHWCLKQLRGRQVLGVKREDPTMVPASTSVHQQELQSMAATSIYVPRVRCTHAFPLWYTKQQVGRARLLQSYCFLLQVPVHVRFCVHLLRVKSLFLPVLQDI